LEESELETVTSGGASDGVSAGMSFGRWCFGVFQGVYVGCKHLLSLKTIEFISLNLFEVEVFRCLGRDGNQLTESIYSTIPAGRIFQLLNPHFSCSAKGFL
jgi:hypothetical protein